MKVFLLAPLALLAACGGPADPPAAPTNGAAAPPPGEPDNRIDCKPAGAAAFARACTVESAESREGRILTIRKADGGFRRLLIDRQGNVFAADGAEQVTLTRTDETGVAPVEVEIGGDRFMLGGQWGAALSNESKSAVIGRLILTAAEMRASEEAAIAAGTPVEELMERAGKGAAEAIWRFAGPLPTLVLCGPGNNGGDGYVIARELEARGMAVRVAALAEPRTPAAAAACGSWTGPIEALTDAAPAMLLVDALFGTGLSRPLDSEVSGVLDRLARQAAVTVAIDLPSGAATDDGEILSSVPDCDLTITFQTLKPSHLLQPAARHMGRLVIADIGIEAASSLHQIARPVLTAPGPAAHKFSRGLVTVVAGAMPGASALAANAAARAGAGAVRLQTREKVAGVAAAVVQTPGDPLIRLDDKRIGAVLLGPGLKDDEEGRALLDAVLASGHALVLDAGALRLLADGGPDRLEDAILTPHQGEFAALFGEGTGSKVERARAAAAKTNATIVYKGPDTVVAAPDGRAAIGTAPHWLASAGTGDVLAGAIAALRAGGLAPFEAACAGVWLHGRAADLAGPGLVADDLVAQLQTAYSECL